MRNYQDLTDREVDELTRLYPVTPNRLLSRQFGISVDALVSHFARPLGWKKDESAIKRKTHGMYHQLTDRDIRWIVKHYKHTKNGDIMEKFNIGESQLNKVRKEYGLKKSTQMMNRVRREAVEHSLMAFREYGESERAAERARQGWAERKASGLPHNVGFKKGESNKTRMSPRRFKQVVEKMRQTRNATIRRDRVRIHWGMEPLTKLVKNWDNNSNWRRIYYRYAMRKRGYHVEKGGDVAYYDEQTKRSMIIEQHAEKYGIVCHHLQ